MTESEWDAEQQDWMLALAEYEASLCPGCGLPFEETADPKNQDRYVTGPPVRCHACTALGVAHERYKDSPHPHALVHIPELKAKPTEG